MITSYSIDEGLKVETGLPERRDGLVWAHALAPESEEVAALERLLGIPLPTLEEMQEIEPTSRLFRRGEALVMTALVPVSEELQDWRTSAVTFIFAPDLLLTLSHIDAAPLRDFAARLQAEPSLGRNPLDLFLALLDGVIDRLADSLEVAAGLIDTLSAQVFEISSESLGARRDFRHILARIGAVADGIQRTQESLFTLDRLLSFFASARQSPGEGRSLLRPLSRDVQSLANQAVFLSDKTSFLLDATLGMVSIEQNAIIKIFSVMAVIFLPPTLIASIYGMNFALMPELEWRWGYPLALLLMVISAILPYRWFKHRGWL